MVDVIDRRAVQGLVAGQEAQLVEVLPLPEYEWAHLPQATHLPLAELDERSSARLAQGRPVIVYCHDWLCDLSPRAAHELERLGFDDVYDYAAGKMDWLSADLPYQGSAVLVSQVVRHDPVISRPGDQVPEVEPRLIADPAGVAVVVGADEVVLGLIGDHELKGAPPEATAADIMCVSMTTIRPSEEVAAVHRRMDHAGLTDVVVTMPDGRLVGIVSAGAVHEPGYDESEG